MKNKTLQKLKSQFGLTSVKGESIGELLENIQKAPKGKKEQYESGAMELIDHIRSSKPQQPQQPQAGQEQEFNHGGLLHGRASSQTPTHTELMATAKREREARVFGNSNGGYQSAEQRIGNDSHKDAQEMADRNSNYTNTTNQIRSAVQPTPEAAGQIAQGQADVMKKVVDPFQMNADQYMEYHRMKAGVAGKQGAPGGAVSRQMMLGGPLNMQSVDAINAELDKKTTDGPSAAGVAGAAGAALSLGQTAFGDNGIATDGTGGRGKAGSIEGAAAGGALKGASAGAAFGPWGMAIGGVVGGAAGIIGGSKAQKDMLEGNLNAGLIENNQFSSTFHKGGSLHDHPHIANEREHYSARDRHLLSRYPDNEDIYVNERGNIVKSVHRGRIEQEETAQETAQAPRSVEQTRRNPVSESTNTDPYTGEYPRLVTNIDQFSKRDRHHGLNPEARHNDFYVDRNGNLVSSVLRGGKAPEAAPLRTGAEVNRPMRRSNYTIPYQGTNQERAINDVISGTLLPGNSVLREEKEAPASQASQASQDPYTGGDLIDKEAIDKILNPTSLSEYEQDASQQERRSFLDDQEAYGNSNITPNSDWQMPGEGEGAEDAKKSSLTGFQPEELLRYAPTVGNALSLLNLDDPDVERYDRLDNRYKEQQVDERYLENRTANSAANTRRLLANYAGGSESAARANILGSQATESRALSEAMSQAQEMNRQDKRVGQQFNLGIDQSNQAISTAETIANSQNRAATDLERSSLRSSIANDLGLIGQERQQSRMLSNLSGGYNSDGTKGKGSLTDLVGSIGTIFNKKKEKGGLLDMAREMFPH